MGVACPEQSDIDPKWMYLAEPMADDGNLLIRDLMRFLPEGMTANSWAVRAGVSRTIWADLKRHGNPSRRTMGKLLEAVGSSLAEFEALSIGQDPSAPVAGSEQLNERGQAWRSAPLPALPLLDTGSAGTWGDPDLAIELVQISRERVIDYIARPTSLAADRHAYALTIVGESMLPRFLPGRRVVISQLAPSEAGDDVLVVLRGPKGQGHVALIKQLAWRTAKAIGLRQHYPGVEFEMPSADVAAVHRVLGELI